MTQLNNKIIRTLTHLIDAGYNNEKAILAMTLDEILALPNISVSEITQVNEIQKAIKVNKIITYLGGGEI